MNWWDLIKEKYPKAYSRYDKEYRISSNSDIYGEHHPNSRVLYDFFDEQGICISIVWVMHQTEDRLEWYYDFAIRNMAAFESSKHYNSRTEAEEQAFLKAFEILEEKL